MSLRLAALLGVLGALGLVLVGSLTASPAVAALAWSAVAAIGLATMLRGPGLRVLGGIALLLAVGAGIAGGLTGSWAWLGVLPALALGVAGFCALRSGHRWRRTAGAGPREAPKDLWKQFDAGDDPTDPR